MVLGPLRNEQQEQRARDAVPPNTPAQPIASASDVPAANGTGPASSQQVSRRQSARLPRQTIHLENGEVATIGSAPDNSIVIGDPIVAPHHARVARNAAGEYTVSDLGSPAGTFVNGYAVRHAELVQGAELRIGPHRYIFTGNDLCPYDAESGIEVDGIDLRQAVHVGALIGGHTKPLLDDISLSIPPGAFVALIGGSGAGKTTLLNALSGLAPAQQGEVLYNGEDLYLHAGALSQSLGYVPQDDIIHRNLTVERALLYAARMRLPKSMDRRQLHERVQQVLEDIDMVPQRHQLISQLSGGQRKRVNIAVELLARPPLFFLDEPNSGLDPGLDLMLMQLLRRLADRGHTVVLATHETRNVEMCDYVCFLAPGGRLAYFGPPQDVKVFFGKTDYAQIYNQLYDAPAEWAARFRQSPDYLKFVAGPRLQSQSRMEAPTRQPAPASTKRHGDHPIRQLMLLTQRYLELLWRDHINLAILIAQAPIIAGLTIVLATAHSLHDVENPGLSASPQDIYAQTSLFVMATSAVWFGTINAAREIVKEAPIYRRERAVNLLILPYVLSKFLVLSVLSAVQTFLLLYIVGLQVGYPNHGLFLGGPRGAFIEMWFTLWLTAVVGLMMGLLISALAPNTDRAVSFVPILLIPQIIFGNVIFTLNGSVGKYISWIMATRWGQQALGSIAGLHDKFTDHNSSPFYASSGAHVLGFWGALVLLALIFFLLTLVLLKRKDTMRR